MKNNKILLKIELFALKHEKIGKFSFHFKFLRFIDSRKSCWLGNFHFTLHNVAIL